MASERTTNAKSNLWNFLLYCLMSEYFSHFSSFLFLFLQLFFFNILHTVFHIFFFLEEYRQRSVNEETQVQKKVPLLIFSAFHFDQENLPPFSQTLFLLRTIIIHGDENTDLPSFNFRISHQLFVRFGALSVIAVFSGNCAINCTIVPYDARDRISLYKICKDRKDFYLALRFRNGLLREKNMY